MIVTDWSDAALTVANDDRCVAAKRAAAAACTRTPPQAEKRRRPIGHAGLATHAFIRSYECAKWLAVPRRRSRVLGSNGAENSLQDSGDFLDRVRWVP